MIGIVVKAVQPPIRKRLITAAVINSPPTKKIRNVRNSAMNIAVAKLVRQSG